jgi:hypothetical protein
MGIIRGLFGNESFGGVLRLFLKYWNLSSNYIEKK